jgi:hypothetical protein
MGAIIVPFETRAQREKRLHRELNHVQFESDNSCRLGWAVRVPI